MCRVPLYTALAHATLAAAGAAVEIAPYAVQPAAASQRFDGIGAISGGGGETVLLPAYPAAEQAEILDFLFKPDFGAALHILKVEIGGDSLSTDGAEPSHMHTENDAPNFERGYEFWLAKQAKQRSQHILLYGLPWEWPSWVGAGTGNPYENVSRTVLYTTTWVKGAKEAHGLSLDFVGVWNEQICSTEYVLALRAALDTFSAHTKIVAPDRSVKDTNAFVVELHANPALRRATHAVGYHYPNSNPGVQPLPGVLTLWASEDDSSVDPPADAPPTPRPRKMPGGGCLVRTINQNFVQGNITATIVWNLVMARYPQMRWDFTGLVAAIDPIGGHYDVLPPVWAAAHTTQFTRPGWKLLPVGQGSGWLRLGGTYVSPQKLCATRQHIVPSVTTATRMYVPHQYSSLSLAMRT